MLRHVLKGKKEDIILSTAISADSQLIATGTSGGIVKMWHADTGQRVCAFRVGLYSPADHLEFSKDGKYLIAGQREYADIVVWDLSYLKKVGVLKRLHTLRGATSSMSAVKLSPDGLKVAVFYNNDTVIFWCVQSGKKLREIQGPEGEMCCAAWSPDCKLLAHASSNNTILIWDSAKPTKAMDPLMGFNTYILCICFGNKRDLLVAAGCDEGILIWEFAGTRATLKQTLRARCASGEWSGIELSPDDRYLASGGYDRIIRLWNISTGQLIRVLEGHSKEVTCLAWSRDGEYLVSGGRDSAARVWEADVKVCDLTWFSCLLSN
jgi:WD40 repeat protein